MDTQSAKGKVGQIEDVSKRSRDHLAAVFFGKSRSMGVPCFRHAPDRDPQGQDYRLGPR